MYSKTKRSLSFLLALVMLVGSIPALTFASIAEAPTTTETGSESYDYSSLYTTDGLVFSWSGFDLKEGDIEVIALENEVGDTDISLSGTPYNGYLYSKGVMDFTPLLEYTMEGENGDVMVFKDFTLEITLRQIDGITAVNGQKGGTFKMPTVNGISMRADNLNEESGYSNWKNMHPIDESYGFISETYGTLAPLSGTANVQMATDVGWKPIKWLGNTQGALYSFGLRFDYTTTEEDPTRGTVAIDYIRDSVTVSPYVGDYNAMYYGNWKSTSAEPKRANPSNQLLSFGGLGYGYSMVRLYNKALTDKQLGENHLADLLSYYTIDPALYTSLSVGKQTQARDLLGKLYVGETTKEAVEEILTTLAIPTIAEIYNPLYVQNGLTYLWDGFDLSFDGQKATSLPSLLEDGVSINRQTEHREWGGTGSSGNGAAMSTIYNYDRSVLMANNNRQLHITNLLPWREFTDGTDVPSDMTFEATLMYPTYYKTSPTQETPSQTYTGYNGGTLYFGPLATGGKGVGYGKFNGNYDYPSGPNKGKGPMSEGIQGPLLSWSSPLSALDSGSKAWLGNYPDKVFNVAYSFNYDEKATNHEMIPYSFHAFRDGSEVMNTVGTYSSAADYSMQDGDITKLQLTFGIDVTTQFFVFRMYSRALSESELQQNHAIDLFKYYGVDPALYKTLDYQVQERLHAALAPYQIGETSKEELDTILTNFALTGGVLGVIDISDYMTFVGAQARTDDYAAIRMRYAVSHESLQTLEDIGALYAFGALYAKRDQVASKEDMTVSYNVGINEFVKNEGNFTLVTACNNGELSEKLSYLSDDGKEIDFGVMLPKVEKADLSNGRINDEYFVRGYLAVFLNGSYFVMYLDTDDTAFGETVSIAEVSEYFVCNGYAFAEIPTLLADPAVLAGAQASDESYQNAYADYAGMKEDISVLNGAYKGASVSSSNFLEIDAIMAKVNMSNTESLPSYAKAVEYAKIAATARGELNVYFELGLKAYEQSKALADAANEKLQARYDATYAALLAYGLNETEAEATALKITAPFANMMQKAVEEVAKLDTAYQMLLSIQQKLSTSQAELKLQKIISASSSLFIEGTTVARYTIITKSEYLVAAQAMQQFFLARQGAFVGIYQIDNPYVSGMHDFSGTKAIYIGLTDKHLSSEDKFSVYYDKDLGSICIEGHNASALLAGASSFLHTFALGTGRMRVSADDIGDKFLAQEYVAMYEMNTQTEFPKINITENSAVGVMEGFMQRLSEMPEHATVVPKMSPDDFRDSTALTLYVATDGSDDNDGSFEKPFATVDRALEEVAYCAGATIMIRGGTYRLAESINVRKEHSGSLTAPLFITNYKDEEVIFTTGLPFSGSKLVRANEANFLPANALSRLNTFKADNSANVYALDLKTLGLTADDLSAYTSGEKAPGLYVGDQSYRVTRWPNYGANDADMLIKGGFVQTMNSQEDVKEVGRVTGGISSEYEKHKNNPNNFFEVYFDQTTYKDHLLTYNQSEVEDGRLWVYGSFYEEWDNRTVRLSLLKDSAGKNYMHSDRAIGYGIKYSKANHIYFFNMIEDLDTELEYQVDVANMVLYLYSEADLSDRELTLCYQSHAAFDVNGTDNVVIDGLNVERSFGLGLNVRNTDHAVVQDFTFRNLSGYAVQMSGTKQSGVTYSEFYVCNGVSLAAGGNQALLEADRNFIQNNRFTNAGDNHGMTVGAQFAGVSTVVSHNYFLETRLYVNRTYECIIEYNEFERGSQYTHDNGPVYVNDNTRALHVRYNYMHDLNNSGYGIYLDDMSSGDYVYGNVVHYADGAASGRCVNLHNSSMNVIVNNICINANGPGINNNINYYAKTINGNSTGGGELGYRWADIIKNRLSKNGNYIAEDIRYDRFPLYAAYTEVVDRAITEMNRNPNWHHSNKISPDEDAEIYVRTPLYNVYMHNVSFGCKNGVLVIPEVGRDTSKIQSNIHFAKGTEGVFTDYENGDFTLPANSKIFDLIPSFVAPDMSQMGVLAD